MLHLHRAERADGLVDALRATLAAPLGDPFAPEVVAVPTRGVERWVAQRLSLGLGARDGHADGVCANVVFPTPRRLVEESVAAATGVDADADPWQPERAVWPLLQVVERHLAEPWLATLAAYLERPERRFGAVRHIAGLFDRYALHRPELVLGWAVGDGGAVGDDARWQVELWRRLRAELDVPSPAERLAGATARLREDPAVAALPPRLAIFGLTRLPVAHLHVLEALAAGHDVHLHLLHPSGALWDRVAAATAAGAPVRRRLDDPTASLAANRLLASWARDARELQLVLDQRTDPVADHHHPVAHRTDTLLARLQADVHADRPPPGDDGDRPLLGADDESLVVHACHGRARQVEVLRDAILHLLADDPTLEPRDVIVLCPDIEAFAPLIHATFGGGEVLEEDDGADDLDEPVAAASTAQPVVPDLRVRLADRSLRQTNPVLGVVARLLDLADARMTASELLDLADREPVRRRFGFDDEDLARLEDWVAGTGIRWGLDQAHRAPFSLAKVPNGTWRAGLDRVLLGVTMTEDDQRLVGGVLPLDDVGSGDVDLAGRFAELVDRVQRACEDLAGCQTVAGWAEALADAADALTATAPREAWQRLELQRLLADVVGEAADAEGGLPLSLAELRALLADRLRGRPTRANFRTGHLTMCTLVPMRAVPHRVVCLLGLDDEVFPRGAPRDGDDLVLEEPHVGDRDGRLEDRQLLLDAFLSATDRVVITYTGKDERTNVRRPPAVPVGELLDVVDRTVRVPHGRPRDQVVVEHPLQPFDPVNHVTGALLRDRPWGFDTTTLAGARALTGDRTAPPPFLPGPLPFVERTIVELDDLVRFVERPVRAFLRQRLGVTVGDYDDEVEDGLAIELDGLGQWHVGQRLLDARLDGAGTRAAILAEIARGTLPPGLLGKAVVDRVAPVVEDLVACAEQLLGPAGDVTSVDVRVALPDGRTLSGTVPRVTGDVLRFVTFSRLAPQHRLSAWVRLLALTASQPGRPFSAVTIGKRRGRGGGVSFARVGPIDADEALAHLEVLVDLHDRGLREPLPLAVKTSAAYAEAASQGRSAVKAAADAWESAFNFPKEDREPEHELVYGPGQPLGLLLAAPPRGDEQGEGWDPMETSRFGRYARRLWDGLLEAEELGDR